MADGMKSIREEAVTKDNEILERRRRFGCEILGPVFAQYIARLDATSHFFEDQRNAKVLFMSRAGLRIRTLLEAYQAATGTPALNSADYLWASRFQVTKACWRDNRHLVEDMLAKEFGQRPLPGFIAALLRYNDPSAELLVADPTRVVGDAAWVRDFLNRKTPQAKAIKAHFEEQSELFKTYLGTLMEGHERALIVDSGWQGTAQRLLADSFPGYEWWGVYFGRSGFADSNRKYWEKMIGLVIETDAFDPARPETSIILNRHIVESLLEPVGPSVEHLVQDEDGTIRAPSADILLKDAPDPDTSPIYQGVTDHIASLGEQTSLADLDAAATEAWQKLARFIVHPTREDVAIYEGTDRSTDFGRAGVMPMVLPQEKRHPGDTAEARIRDSIWPAGQAIAEYPAEMALPLQRKRAGVDRAYIKGILPKPRRIDAPGSDALVAVITRTLDRPMFLRRAMESVARQTFKDYVHVVVCDGGDIEEVRQTINTSACDRSKVLLVDNVVNRGMEAASNRAIESSSSDFIVIHDDDDSWEPSFLAETIAFLTGPGKDYGGVITKSTYVSEEVTPEGLKIHGTSPYQDWVDRVEISEMAIGNYFPPIAFLFRRTIYDTIGGFNESLPVLGDWDFNLRFLLEADIGVLRMPLANYHHRDVGDTLTFGNSVIADQSKHSEFSALVRNNFMRMSIDSHTAAIAQVVGIGNHLSELRHRIRAAEIHAWNAATRPIAGAANAAGVMSASQLEQSDTLWVAMYEKLAGPIPGLRSAMRKLRSSSLTPDEVMQAAGRIAKRATKLLPPPDFNEQTYLNENPDVREAVAQGAFASGFDHFFRFGRQEGRARPGR